MKSKKKNTLKEIFSYDTYDTSTMINGDKPLSFKDINLSLPETPPTQVVSIRLPSALLNELRALGSERDVAYHALVKMLLAEGVADLKAKNKKVA